MEAIAALGVAGNTVQFLDFATKLCVTSIEIYRNANGSSSTNSHAEQLLRSFIETVDEVSADLHGYFHALSAASTQASQQGDTHIKLIIADCQAIASDLTKRIDTLKSSGKPGKWKSFMTGIKCLWRKDELDALQKRLAKNREELEWRIILSLREGLNLLASRQQDQFQELQTAVVAQLTDVIRHHVSSLPQWPKTIEQTMQQIRDDISQAMARSTQPENMALCAPHTETNKSGSSPPVTFPLQYARYCASKLAEVEEARWQSLAFQVMDDRGDQITNAESKTFQWILEAPQQKQCSWDSFLDWLRNEGSIYWISGKAGSGKSTMMKYLKCHEKVQSTLEEWSGNTPLIIASFYFWYNGNALQKTQEGLLRSLLYQALENHRELIPIVLAETFTIPASDLSSYWTLPRLKRAFKRLMEQDSLAVKICLLVDGLDEYAGDHAEIVEIFRIASSFSHVKVCVSSRPLLIFDRAFKRSPGLVMQDLTFQDIQTYVEIRFRNDERFQELELEEPGLGPDIASQVVQKASGVFLWVRLVVHSLLQGIQNYDRGVDLERRLNELPEDLYDLYWHMLDRVTPTWYLAEGFRLLLLVKSAQGPLSLLRLTFAEYRGSTKPEDISSLLLKRQTALCTSMAGRIKSRCLGLVEVISPSKSSIVEDSHVQFLHKSVSDFIESPQMMDRMQASFSREDPDWAEVALIRAVWLELQTARSRYFSLQIVPQDELKRDTWFRIIFPLGKTARLYAGFAERRFSDPGTQVRAWMAKVDEITTEYWNTVKDRSAEECSGAIHWSDALFSNGGSTGSVESDLESPSLALRTRP